MCAALASAFAQRAFPTPRSTPTRPPRATGFAGDGASTAVLVERPIPERARGRAAHVTTCTLLLAGQYRRSCAAAAAGFETRASRAPHHAWTRAARASASRPSRARSSSDRTPSRAADEEDRGKDEGSRGMRTGRVTRRNLSEKRHPRLKRHAKMRCFADDRVDDELSNRWMTSTRGYFLIKVDHERAHRGGAATPRRRRRRATRRRAGDSVRVTGQTQRVLRQAHRQKLSVHLEGEARGW